MAVRARPDRDLVAPPELPRDAPVGRLLERLDREAVLALGVVADAPRLERLDRGARELVHPAPPLRRDERLDARVAALAGADRVAVVLALLELAVLLRASRRRARPPPPASAPRSPSAIIRPSGPITVSVASPWSRPISKSIGSWPGVILSAPEPNSGSTRASAITGTCRPTTGTTTSLPIASRVARVVRVHRDGDVGEDRRRPHRRDRDRAGSVDERVARVGERVVHLDVLDLEVGDRRLVVRAPVDDPVRAVDPPRVPQPHEVRHHGVDVAVVHREALARVVERAAEPAELAHDHAAGALEPRPGALEERLAADLLPRGALGDQLLLDHVLGRDAGVVVARLPERVVARACGASGSGSPASSRSGRGPCAARR